jgi:hypothetical protein
MYGALHAAVRDRSTAGDVNEIADRDRTQPDG